MESLSCKICYEDFSEERIPLIVPCGHTFCSICLSKIDEKERKILCPLDKEEFYVSLKNLRRNYMIIDFFESSQNAKPSPSFMCDEHPEKKIKYRTVDDKKLLCTLCMWDHVKKSGINNKVEAYTEHDIIADGKRILNMYANAIEHLKGYQSKIEDIVNFKGKENKKIIQTYSQALNYMIDPKYKTLMLTPFLKSLVGDKTDYGSSFNDGSCRMPFASLREKENSTRTVNVPYFKTWSKPEIAGELPGDNVGDSGEIENTNPLKISSIVTNKPLQDILLKWLPKSNASPKLLYNSKRDGLTAKRFHELCDDYAPTLVVVKTTKNQIFGGYSVAQWNHKGYNVMDYTGKSFVFSLTNRSKHPMKAKFGYAIHADKELGPVFGVGYDLFIKGDDSNDNYSNLGSTYSLPCGKESFSRQSKEYLAGTEHFQVEEYEVYFVAASGEGGNEENCNCA